MKKLKSSIYLAGLVILGLSSCTKGFEELNRDPNNPTTPNLDYIFTYSLVRVNGTDFDMHRANLIYSAAMIQHFASLNGYWVGDKYVYNSEYSGAFFGSMYPGPIREITQLVDATANDAALVNKNSAARILRVYAMHRMTDIYGDVPYFEAGRGYTNGILKPKYDKQSEIYADMLKELEQAAAAFNPARATFGAADVLYQGNITQWRKFAYSLMLRLGMRLTKVDAAAAQQWVNKAIAGGVFTSEGDIAILRHAEGPEGINRNPNNIPIQQQELQVGTNNPANSKLSKTFIDFLKNNNDPRLRMIARLHRTENADPAVQKGLPNGYDNTTILAYPGFTNINDYSDPNIKTIARLDAPSIFMSTAEVKFLLAEAAVRGWGSGNAQTLYNEGVTAAMLMMNQFNASGSGVANITQAEVTAYLAANPFNNGGTVAQRMEQIHRQLWAALFMNSIEAWASWRRSGYPALTPVNYPGNITNGQIPRRLRYPEAEAVNNADNYKAAVAQQGADEFTTRMWWDKP